MILNLKKSVATIVLVGLLIAAIAGCDQQPDPNLKADSAESAVEETPTAESVARVNGRDISRQAFDGFLQFKRVPTDSTTRYESMLTQYLEREALADTIAAEDLLDNIQIEAELNEFRKELLINRYFENFLKNKASDVELRNYYQTNIENYKNLTAQVAHILLRTNSAMDETERSVRLTTIREAYSKLTSGADFAQVAREYSEDKNSKAKGGEIGWIKQGDIDPRFSELVFSLQKGAISEPFITSFGYHIVTVLDGPATLTRPFEAVKGDIRYLLRNQARDAEYERLLGKVSIER